MAAGLGLLRLSPTAFWAMTPSELDAAMRGINGVGVQSMPPGRDALLDMIASFPDEIETSGT